MAAVTDAVIPYPGMVDQRLEVDPVFKEFQKDGLVRVQLPYGEPWWRPSSSATPMCDYRFRPRK
jgi:hypothetical protein